MVVVFFTLNICALVFLNNESVVLIEMICIYCKYLNTGKIEKTKEH